MDKPIKRDLTLLAAEALDKAHGNVQDATESLYHTFSADMDLYRQLMDPLLRTAVYNLVRDVCQSKRRAVWLPPNYDKGGKGSRIKPMSESNLMHFPLWDGTYLGDADKEKIMEAVKYWGAQGSDMLRKSKWLKLVAPLVPKGKLVKQVLSEAKLRELKKKVEGLTF